MLCLCDSRELGWSIPNSPPALALVTQTQGSDSARLITPSELCSSDLVLKNQPETLPTPGVKQREMSQHR